MMKKFAWAAVLLLGTFLAANANAGTVESRFDLSIGGYVKLDYINQNANLGSPLSSPVPAEGSLKANQNESIFTARQTRLNVTVKGPEFEGAKTMAFVEGDFYGGGTSSNESANFRMRHAYGALSWEKTQVLFGQYWDMFGPLVMSTIDFRSGQFTGAPNNPRVPQVRVTHRFTLNENNSIRVLGGAQNPVENFKGDSTSGDMVNFAGQAMLVSKSLGVAPGYWGLPMNPLTVGLFGLWGKEDIASGTDANKDSINVYGYGLYAFVPLLKSTDGKSRAMTLSLESQAYLAAGLDVLGATALNTVGTTGDLKAAKGFGFAGQLIFYPVEAFGVTAGYGRRAIQDTGDYKSLIPAQAPEKYNEQYFANVAYDLNQAIRVAAEYQHLKTKYLAVPSGATGDTGDADVIRLSAMYFF